MRAAGALTLLAVLLWAAALVPLGPGKGRTLWLVDGSDSVGGSAYAREVLDRLVEEEDPHQGQVLVFAALWTDPFLVREEVPGGATRLGETLADLRDLLRPGDRVVVFSDGCATDALPPVAGWEGIRVEWRPAPPRPRIARIEFPPAWPPARTLRGRVLLRDADAGAGALAIEAGAGLPLESATILPLGPQEWEVEIVAAAIPNTPVRLAFTWTEGGRADRAETTMAPPGKTLWWSPDAALQRDLAASGVLSVAASPSARAATLLRPQETGAETLRQLDAGGVVVVAAARAEEWWALDDWLPRPLIPDPAPGTRLLVLLDHSGSMEGQPLREAWAAVRAWSRDLPATVPIGVRPFAATLEAPIDPRKKDDRIPDQAFGPTRLAQALAEILESAQPEAVLVLVSDAQAEAPEGGWAALGAALRRNFRQVLCVPAGPQADLGVLMALGAVPEADFQRGLGERLGDSLSQPLQLSAAGARAVPGALWTLPDPAPGLPARDRFRAATGAQALLQDAGGAMAAAAVPVRRGLLVGLAAEPGREWAEALSPLVAEFLGRPRLAREDGQVGLRGNGEGWRLRPAGSEEPGTPFDPWAAEDWRAAARDPAGTVEAVAPDGTVYLLPPRPPGENEAGPGPWLRWLTAVEAAQPVSGLRKGLLVAGLLCAVAALGAGRAASRG